MKFTKLIRNTFLLALLFIFESKEVSAQMLYVGSETEMTILKGTEFSFDNLVLIPSNRYLIKDNLLQLGTHASFPNGNAISKTYLFLKEPLPFSGSTEFRFKENELNGLGKSELKIQILENSSWKSMESTSMKFNAVSSNTSYSIIPKEITLGNKDHLADFYILSNPVLNNMLKIQVNKQGNFSLYTNDGKLLMKKYFQEGMHEINLHQYAHAMYMLSTGKNTKKFIL